MKLVTPLACLAAGIAIGLFARPLVSGSSPGTASSASAKTQATALQASLENPRPARADDRKAASSRNADIEFREKIKGEWREANKTAVRR